MKEKDISKYWDAKAEALKTEPSATMKDVILRTMEIEAIGERLQADDDLLDVGGGNAFAGLNWANRCQSVLVTDFSEKMVAFGAEAIAKSDQKNICIERANVLDLSPYSGKFSATSCVRCLINLTSQDDQMTAIDQLAGTLRPNGRLFLIEGLEESYAEMNAVRETMGLKAIPLDWHNKLLSRTSLEARLSQHLRIEQRVDFGEYYFLSRVIHPLLLPPHEEPKFDSPCNLTAREVWRRGIARGKFAHMSTLVLYVCTRP